MAPRKTRSSTAAQRRAASKKVPPTRALRHEAVEEEFKAEDPDPNHVLTQQLENQTPRKPQSRQNRTNTPESDTILSGTYLSGAGRNSSALSKRLKETWQELQQTPSRQQQREDGVVDANMTQKLHIVAAELLQEKLLKHHDKNVRSLVACCLVELARVSAPDSPFSSNEELYRVFQLFIEQLRALSPEQTTTSRYLHHFHVLESLATVKSCLLVVGLDFTVEEEEDVVMVQLFEALFETFGENHSAKIENLMLSIMVACIEESDAVDLSLLDVILKPLVDAVNTDEPNGVEVDTDNSVKRNSAHMARELIRRTSDLLQNPLSNFFNNILIDGSSSLGSQQSSELKEHVHTLIYEVHKINPSLLLYVLPNVCLQLQVDEVATRSDAITLMGKLFASSHADYGHQYMKNFRDFLGRFRDASKEIRLQMIQVTVSVWENKPDMAEMLEKEFILRLSDPEWEVRQLVVRELCDFAANCLDLISEECLRAVGERMKDKKVTLRKETMTGLSQVFSAHISTYWEENEDEKRPLSLNHRNIPAAHIKKLGWIPDYVLKCYAYPQQELKLRVIQLLDDFLLPKAFSERARANGLLFLFHSLDATSKEALRRIFNERAKCQDVCKKFVDFKVHNRQKQRATEVDESALDTVKQQLYNGLSPLFSDVSGLNKLLEKLSKWKDHSVFKHLGELCDYSKSQQDARQARDQLVRSVGSKTPLGEFLKKLCRKLSLLTMNQASSAVLLDFLVLKEGRPSRENRSIVDLLVMASGELPELIAPFICDKITAILVGSTDDQDANVSVTSDEEDEEEPMRKDPRVILGTLHVLANYSRYWAIRNSLNGDAAEGNVPSANLVEKLHNFCLGGTDVEAQNFNAAKESRAAELAAFTLAHFYGKLEETTQLVRQLCSKDKLGSPKTSGALPALQSLEMFTKRCSQIFSEDESLFSRLWTHLLEDLIGKGEESLTPGTPASKERTPRGSRPVTAKLAEVRCLAIKIAVNLLVYCQSTRGSPDSQGHGTRLIKLLFGILRSGGNTFGSTPALAASFRTAASCGLMKIIRKRQFEALVSVPEWHLLGLTMQDSSEDVRRKFLKKLTSHLMKQSVQHPHKFLSYLALAATDASTSLKKDARNLLKVAVERMRRVFDAASSRESEELRSPGTPTRSALMVPEYALPYVIHLVAHHPQFPVKLVERTPTVMVLRSALWSDQLAYLNFFLDGLVSANSSAADNIAFLLQILTKLSQCHDVEAPGDINIYPLIDSAAVLLKKKIKKQSNLQPFPGKIFLPKHLYRPGRPSTLATPGGRKEPESQESLGATAVRGPRIATSLSPIRPMDFAAHFMKLNSPPGSSLKAANTNKRKRSLLQSDDGDISEEEKEEDNEDEPEPRRRLSVLGNSQPTKRTYADDSSDSGAESDSLLPSSASRSNTSQLNEPASAASSLRSAGSRQAIIETIVEEKEEEQVEAPTKKRMTSKGVAAQSSPTYEKPRLRSVRRRQ